MESVISRILEIDKMAEEKLEEVKELEKQLAIDTQADCDALAEEMRARADRAIDDVEAVNKFEFSEITKENEAKYRAEIKVLNDFYQAKHEEIESRIFEQIVGEIS